MTDEPAINIADLFSPIDFRYHQKELVPYFSDGAFLAYKCKAEAALAYGLADVGVCTPGIAKEIEQAAAEVEYGRVVEIENKIHHDMRAVANAIKEKVSDQAKPFVHLTATSYDIIDTANAARFRDGTLKVIIPEMLELGKVFLNKAEKYAEVPQVGRTHGQHASPLTFGLTMAWYADRWMNRTDNLMNAACEFLGKMSGPVGARNPQLLVTDMPRGFESTVLSQMDLEQAEISTQIVPPEVITDYMHALISAHGVLADYGNAMRHLQRTEIGETGEPYDEKHQVGSSTMPHKRNPWNYENVVGQWKKNMPTMVTVYMNQISDHQRDLTNSAPMRWYPEVPVVFFDSVKRIKKITGKMSVDRENMSRNLDMHGDKILAEPMYILLSRHGHPNAHEYVRKLTIDSVKLGKPLHELFSSDGEIVDYYKKFSDRELEIIRDPRKYIGTAVEDTHRIVEKCRTEIRQLEGILLQRQRFLDNK